MLDIDKERYGAYTNEAANRRRINIEKTCYFVAAYFSTVEYDSGIRRTIKHSALSVPDEGE